MKRIESALIKAADKIQESMAGDCSKRVKSNIQRLCEGITDRDKGGYQLGLDEWPPTRILLLTLTLSAWVGWIMHEKHGSSAEQLFSSRVCLQMW